MMLKLVLLLATSKGARGFWGDFGISTNIPSTFDSSGDGGSLNLFGSFPTFGGFGPDPPSFIPTVSSNPPTSQNEAVSPNNAPIVAPSNPPFTNTFADVFSSFQPTPQVPPSTPTPSSSTAAAVALGSQQGEYLSAHNVYRRTHCVNELSWSNSLENAAQNYAAQCNWAHDPTLQAIGQGENLYAYAPASSTTSQSASVVVGALYDEIKDYDYNDPGFSLETGHFTQIVWSDTTQVGCFVYICPEYAQNGQRISPVSTNVPGDWMFTVCRYSPPGNVRGQFAQKVPPVC